MNIFLRQELDRMQKVLKTVRTTLTDLKLAIDGTIIMNDVRNTALRIISLFVLYYQSNYNFVYRKL